MNATAFDTLKLVRALRETAKLSPEQAQSVASAVAVALQESCKADLAECDTRAEVAADLRETEFQSRSVAHDARTHLFKMLICATLGLQALIAIVAFS